MQDTATANAQGSSGGHESGPKPNVSCWHFWTDGDGVSRQRSCALTDFLKDVGGADPQWNKHGTASSTVVATVQPVGWAGAWRENPAPQWIEGMDGTRIEQGPGEFSFGEDQGCTETDGKKGRRSGTVGGQPAALTTVQPRVDPKREPCHVG